jgi:hypothetical protein
MSVRSHSNHRQPFVTAICIVLFSSLALYACDKPEDKMMSPGSSPAAMSASASMGMGQGAAPGMASSMATGQMAAPMMSGGPMMGGQMAPPGSAKPTPMGSAPGHM